MERLNDELVVVVVTSEQRDDESKRASELVVTYLREKTSDANGMEWGD